MIQLFTHKGPEEPIRSRGLGQSHPCYVMGREDFIFQRGYFGGSLIAAEDRRWYQCGWKHEQLELEEMRRLLARLT